MREILNLLKDNDKIYGAFLLNFKYDSHCHIVLFTDLKQSYIKDIENKFNYEYKQKVRLSNICDIPDSIQEYIMENEDSQVLFMKEDYIINWQRHKLYLNQEIHFRKVLNDWDFTKGF